MCIDTASSSVVLLESVGIDSNVKSCHKKVCIPLVPKRERRKGPEEEKELDKGMFA